MRFQLDGTGELEPAAAEVAEVLRSGDLGASDWAAALGLLVVGVVLGRISRTAVSRSLGRAGAEPFVSQLLSRLLNYLVVVLALFYALTQLGVAVGPLLGGLGLFGVALAFALSTLLENFLAGLFLQVRRPFTAGEEVESGDQRGRIEEVNARSVLLTTPTGELVEIPARTVLDDPIVNLTRLGGRRTDLPVQVGYTTDLDRAVEVIRDAVRAVDGVRVEPPVQALVSSFDDSGITVVARFWHEPSIAQQWAVTDRVARAMHRCLAEHDIEIPFPQRVVHLRDDDG